MADNKGSSSNPTKGLVTHLDRNRNLQQDRTVASSSVPAISFRSQPPGHSAAAAEASFTNFTNGVNQQGVLPVQPAIQQPPRFRSELGRAWLRDFSRLNVHPAQDSGIMAANQDTPTQEAASRAAVYHDVADRAAADRAAATANGTGTGIWRDGGLTQGPVFQPHLDVSRLGGYQIGVYPSGPVVHFDEHVQSLALYQQHMHELAAVSPTPEQYDVYPEQLLADNPGQAMEAAFAAYDEDFQGEMDEWMRVNGPEGREDQVHVQVMEELIAADAIHEAMPGNFTQKIDMGPSLKPNVPGSNIDTYEYERGMYERGISDRGKNPYASRKKLSPESKPMSDDGELRKHAVQILGTLRTEGSSETKEKLKASSFCGLMEAIANGQAVVQGETFVDPSSGKVIEDWGALGDGISITEMSNGTGTVESKMEGEGKGKDKMKTLEEQAKEQH